MPVQEVSVDEVVKFLNIREQDYNNCLKLFKMRFQEFMLSANGEGKVYRIYSRGEKQRGKEFKEYWKIAEKVNEIRRGNEEKNIQPNPGFPIQDLGDIIGLTVVCVYSSDMNAVINFIENAIDQNQFVEFDREEKQERGYHAHHFVFGSCYPNYAGIRCEVQIRTLLHDAYSAKTHGLTYKPEGELDERMRRQMEILGDSLAAIDEQSELIGLMIREKWVHDMVRKEGARRAILMSLKVQQGPQRPERVKQFDEIIDDLQQNEAVYREKDYTSKEVSNILDKINKFVGQGSHDLHSCRMLAILASMRPKNDLDNLAIDTVDRWIATLSPADKASALVFKGLVLFCFGRLEYAIQVTEEALQHAQTKKLKRWTILAKANLAYFLTDLADMPAAKHLDIAAKARKYIDEALEEAQDEKDISKAELEDTLGAVMISFGKTPEDVRLGLQMCQKACDENPDREVAGLFFQIHERRAFRRLLQWP